MIDVPIGSIVTSSGQRGPDSIGPPGPTGPEGPRGQNLTGITNGSPAPTGQIGEILSVSGTLPAQFVSSYTFVAVSQLTLPAGHWLCNAAINWTASGGGTTAPWWQVFFGTGDIILDGDDLLADLCVMGPNAWQAVGGWHLGPRRYNVTTPITIRTSLLPDRNSGSNQSFGINGSITARRWR